RPLAWIDLARIHVAEAQRLRIRARYAAGQGDPGPRPLIARLGVHGAVALHVRRMCEHAEWEVAVAVPVGQEVGQNAVAHGAYVVAVHLADLAQVRREDDQLTALRQRRLELVGGLGRGPQLVVHGRRARQDARERPLDPPDVALRGEVRRLGPRRLQVAYEQ